MIALYNFEAPLGAKKQKNPLEGFALLSANFIANPVWGKRSPSRLPPVCHCGALSTHAFARMARHI
jgi:hypothetical protein